MTLLAIAWHTLAHSAPPPFDSGPLDFLPIMSPIAYRARLQTKFLVSPNPILDSLSSLTSQAREMIVWQSLATWLQVLIP